ncbi:hypothetical protein WH96_19350 [Kiloniella spongiae]|uniref:Chemotaxis protein n=2 Tax=Kiloniella spongiae TaxID=1489064 RepID=A0A0H2MEM4_9PROT|nr:hypothetical protein WH96_19350 [Kiloniella spongiae]
MGAILSFLIAVSISSYIALSRANEEFDSYRALARETNQMGRIQANLLSARLGVKDYIIKNSDEAAQNVRDRAEATEKIIQKSKTLFKNKEHLKTIVGAIEQIALYRSSFEEVTLLVKKRNQLVEQLNNIGPKSEQTLTKIMKSAFEDGDATAAYRAGVSMRHLLLARLYSNRFLVDNLQDSANRSNQELNSFKQTSEEMLAELQNPVRRELASTVVNLANDYQNFFSEVTITILKRNNIITDTLDLIGPRLADQVEQIKLSNKKAQDTLGPKVTRDMHNATLILEIIAIIAIITGSLLALLTGRAISRPICKMTEIMGLLAKGDHSAEVPSQDRKDEIGDMAGAVQVFKDNAIEMAKLQEEQAITAKRAIKEKDMMNELAKKFEGNIQDIVDGVSKAANEMQITAQTMSLTAEKTEQQADAATQASSEASTNVQTVAGSSEELAASIQEISAQVSRSTDIVSKATSDAKTTNTQVEGLVDSAEKIGQVVNLIQDIAEQTNLLALNATIEAARAGDAGKGFAVVASEVKSLANQTAKATEEISQQVSNIQEATAQSASSIKEIGLTVSQVNEISESIAAAVEEQGAATQEIARNVQESSSAAELVSTNITGVTNTAKETGEAAQNVLSASGKLQQQSQSLSDEVSDFLSKVRAA